MNVQRPTNVKKALSVIAWLAQGVTFVNWRDEPSARSADLGDLQNGTWLQLYPDSKRDGFVWAALRGEDGTVQQDGWLWRKSLEPQAYRFVGFADGYDAPIGTDAERAAMGSKWPGGWYNASPFGQRYLIDTPYEALHTGIDFNLAGNADARQPVYACADGVVTFVDKLPRWGNVIVIQHEPMVGSNRVLFSRYAHVLDDIRVRQGQTVLRGQQIARVGNAGGTMPDHLHFDLSPTRRLGLFPQDWPGKDRSRLLRDYIDPLEWIVTHRPLVTSKV